MIELLTFLGYSMFLLIAGIWIGEIGKRNNG